MKKKHLEFYKKCINNDYTIPFGGLCTAAKYGYIDRDIFTLFYPTDDDYLKLIDENKVRESFLYDPGATYWASGLTIDQFDRQIIFSALRQTIVLFMAAIVGEFD